MSKKKRYYQTEAKKAVADKLSQGITKQMVVLPTGAGKTFTATDIILDTEGYRELNFGKVLWITHTEELINQSALTLVQAKLPTIDVRSRIGSDLINYLKNVKDANAGLFREEQDSMIVKEIGVIKQERFDLDANIVVASIQTLHRRLDKIAPNAFDCIVTDECHLIMAKTWTKAISYLQPRLLLGITATPYRLDGMGLGNVFDEIVYDYTLLKAIQEGFLVEFNAVQVRTNLNLDDVKTVAGEFNQKELEMKVNSPERNNLIVDAYIEHAKNKKAIGFCVDVKHCMDLCQTFNRRGIHAEFIVGDTTFTPDRQQLLERHKRGEFPVLLSVMILTAGYDDPSVECILQTAPTKSLTKFIQQLGRGSRTWPGCIDNINTIEERLIAISNSPKTECLVIDVVDNTHRHSLINTWELDKALPIEERIFIKAKKKEQLIKKRQDRIVTVIARDKDKKLNLLKLPKPKKITSVRMQEAATEKQLQWIESLGYDVENIEYTKAMCSEIIDMQPATEKQIKFLRWKGYDISSGVTVAEAAAAFKELKDKEEKEIAKTVPRPQILPFNDLF